MEYGQIFHVMRIGKYYCKNMKYRINIYIYIGIYIYIYIYIYNIYIYMFVYQKTLNCTLAIDSPFQTFAVRLLVEFIVTVGRPDDKQNHCRTGEEFECEKLRFRGSPLACGVMFP